MVKRYLLDSNVWIQVLRANKPRASDRLIAYRVALTPPSEVAGCSTVRAELIHGAWKYEDPAKRIAKVEILLGKFDSLPFDDRAADVYGRIRDELERSGNVIGPFDMQIAAIALVHDLTVVTSNVSEFRRVRNLRVEDWSVLAHG